MYELFTQCLSLFMRQYLHIKSICTSLAIFLLLSSHCHLVVFSTSCCPRFNSAQQTFLNHRLSFGLPGLKFCNERQQPRPHSFIVLSSQIFGHLTQFTTLTSDDFWATAFWISQFLSIFLWTIVLIWFHQFSKNHCVFSMTLAKQNN